MRLKTVLDEETRCYVYQAFVFSCFTYCPSVWLVCNATIVCQLEKIHCMALRFFLQLFSFFLCIPHVPDELILQPDLQMASHPGGHEFVASQAQQGELTLIH